MDLVRRYDEVIRGKREYRDRVWHSTEMSVSDMSAARIATHIRQEVNNLCMMYVGRVNDEENTRRLAMNINNLLREYQLRGHLENFQVELGEFRNIIVRFMLPGRMDSYNISVNLGDYSYEFNRSL